MIWTKQEKMLKLFQSIKNHFKKPTFMNENIDQMPKNDIITETTDNSSTENHTKSTEKIETLETEEVLNEEVLQDIPVTENLANNISDNIAEESNNTDKVAQELADQKDKYLRLLADFENFRRRTAKEKLEFLEQANAKLILELLPVLDDFERAAKSMESQETSIESVKNGITLVYGKFLKSLERQGLMPIHSNGEVFDVEKHEAITQIPAPTEDMKGKIVDTVEKGYTLGDKVVRFAKVVIGQ